jgi:hypothetical protein
MLIAYDRSVPRKRGRGEDRNDVGMLFELEDGVENEFRT